MARTVSASVVVLLGKDYDTINTPSLTGFIDSASAIIDRVVICAAAKGITFSDVELELLERWVAAHLYVQSDATYKSRRTLRAAGEFNKDWDSYLKAAYGLDPSGCLKSAFTSNRVSAFWMGKVPSNQIPYVDRD